MTEDRGDRTPAVDLPEPDLAARDEAEEKDDRRVLGRQGALRLHSTPDVVAVMEPEHLAEIRRHWPAHAQKVRVLGVPDDYDPEEPELRRVLESKVRALLEEFQSTRPRARDRRTR